MYHSHIEAAHKGFGGQPQRALMRRTGLQYKAQSNLSQTA
jgi:hypothetical protein